MENPVVVDLGDRSYPIHIGPGARRSLASLVSGTGEPPQAVVIADEHVADLHMPVLRAALPAKPLELLFPQGENSKSLSTVGLLAEHLAGARIERGAVIVAFGGGVAGDLAGFVAATWLRGVRFIQVPTTLLAAVDASVGGKTGVNLNAGKNLVGAFHQPIGVVVDTDFLGTLPDREYRAGLAESVKHALIRDAAFFAWHARHAAAIRVRDAGVLSELIAWNCRIKAAVVSADEREVGLRVILNHGHTIGHAIEHVLSYELRHGECVALGMLAENAIATARGLLDEAIAAQVRELLSGQGLPTRLPRGVDPAQIIERCRVDKKVAHGAVNFVLLREIGDPVRVSDVREAEIAAGLAAIQPA